MRFNSRFDHCQPRSFKIGNHPIKEVDTYCCLGIEIHNSGSGNINTADAVPSSSRSFDEAILDQLENNDPFFLLPPAPFSDDPAAGVSVPPPDSTDKLTTSSTVPEPSTASTSTLPSSSNAEAPIPDAADTVTKRKKRFTFRDLRAIRHEYESVMDGYNEGASIDSSCRKIGIGRTAFYTRKYLTEMMLGRSRRLR